MTNSIHWTRSKGGGYQSIDSRYTIRRSVNHYISKHNIDYLVFDTLWKTEIGYAWCVRDAKALCETWPLIYLKAHLCLH